MSRFDQTLARKEAPKPKRRLFPLWMILITLLLLAHAGLSFIQRQLSAVNSDTTSYEFEVLPGWGASRVSNALEAAGLIRSARLFSAYLQYSDLDTSLGEGLYDLSPNMSASDIAAALVAGGRPRTLRVVIPEGFRISDIARTLGGTELGTEEAFLSLIEAPTELAPDYSPEGASLEGYLFPASYDVPVKSSPSEVLAQMLSRFEEELSPEIKEQLAAKGYSVHDWVSLASIVQAEAANAEEMPIIAGVFENRLVDGMPLQSDPTVAYGLGKDLPELDYGAGDFSVEHPWNTYVINGIPLGPIGNPGSDALRAVLEPVTTNPEGQPYFFFLHGTDNGEPVFKPNVTFAEHTRDADLYLR